MTVVVQLLRAEPPLEELTRRLAASCRRRGAGRRRSRTPSDPPDFVRPRSANQPLGAASEPLPRRTGGSAGTAPAGRRSRLARRSTCAVGSAASNSGAEARAIGPDGRADTASGAGAAKSRTAGPPGVRSSRPGGGQQRVAQRLRVEPARGSSGPHSRFSGSAASVGSAGTLDCRYVAESMISRCIALIDQPALDERRPASRATPGASAARRARRSCSACGPAPRRSGAARRG